MASADLEGKAIIIHDAFYRPAEGDDKGLNARTSVILHEVAHLIGLESDVETESLESAECLRRFSLLVGEILKPEDLFERFEIEAMGEREEESGNLQLPFNLTITRLEVRKADSSLPKTAAAFPL